MEAEPALLAEGLSKRFGGRHALSAASLVLRRGRIGGIIGPNGAGKSTLVGVLAGTVRPDAGGITLAGRDVLPLAERERARLGLARSFQLPHIFPTLTLRQHITLRAADGGWGWEMARRLGLDGALDAAAGTFSHGTRRLAEICHLAAGQPAVLLLDEPAAGLTAFEMRQLADALAWLKAHTAIGVVEHNMDFLLPLADDVTVLEAGRVIARGTPSAVAADPEVRRAYLGPGFAAAEPRTAVPAASAPAGSESQPDPAALALLEKAQPERASAARTSPDLPITGPSVIELADIHARRGGVPILHGVTFTVAVGEAVALFGRNGMGKTTTLDCIAGRVALASGTLRILGGGSSGGKPHRVVRRGLGYVPESRGIFAPLTVGEHLRLSRKLGGAWPAERILVLFPDLRDRLHEPAGRLSGGQQQMVAIARALSADPTVLMLDEPTAGLAPLVIEAIARALREVRQAGLTLLIVEQTMAIAGQVAGRFLFMADGRIVAEADAAGLAADPGLFDRHLGLHLG